MNEQQLRQLNHAAHNAIERYGDGDTVLPVRVDDLAWLTDILIGALDAKRARQAQQKRAQAAR
ncbi:MAG: hypothetical protein WC657_05835 [Candidatus Paceibacterota bacterium]|jgi:hypothetical protein